MKNLIPKRVMEYIIITFAVVLMDVGIYVFKFPNNFSFGGVSGMAVVFFAFYSDDVCADQPGDQSDFADDRVYCPWSGFWSEDGLCYGCFFFASECV